LLRIFPEGAQETRRQWRAELNFRFQRGKLPVKEIPALTIQSSFYLP
jgi:hypothetical protein